MNSTASLRLSKYVEYLLSQVSQTDDVAMMDLGSQAQPLQEVVSLLTQDAAPVKQKEEVAADEGKPPAQESKLLEKRHSKPMLLKL
jgi:hypothetical protein